MATESSLPQMGSDLDIRVLGPLEVRKKGQPVSLGGIKQRTVLAVLLLSPNEVVGVDSIIQAVWGEDAAASSLRTLQVYLSKLRKALRPAIGNDAELIETAAPGYRAIVDVDELDLLRFKETVDRARELAAAGEAERAVELYRQGLGLWHGRLLADLAGTSSTIDREADRLEMTRLTAHTDCLEVELALGRHAEVLPEIHHLVETNSLNERLRGLLMVALYRSGRHTDALDAYRDIRGHLAEDLGLEPGSELRQLEEKILLHDESLKEPKTAPPGTTLTIEQSPKPTTAAWVESNGESYQLDRAVTTVGRYQDRTIVLDNPTVSRRHAEIRRVGSRLALVDVGSMNGVAVNGRAVLEHDLEDGDVIHIGAVELVFRTES